MGYTRQEGTEISNMTRVFERVCCRVMRLDKGYKSGGNKEQETQLQENLVVAEGYDITKH